MKKRYLIIVGLVLALACAATLLIQGRTLTFTLTPGYWNDPTVTAEDFAVETKNDLAELTDLRMEDGALKLSFRAVKPGRESFSVLLRGKTIYLDILYMHPSGVITVNTFFGHCDGDWILRPAVFFFSALLLCSVILTYRANVKKNLYSYKNVRNLGLIFYLSLLLAVQTPYLFIGSRGLDEVISFILSSASGFANVALPAAFVIFVLVTLSNLQLMRREGRTWRNLLGFFLGILLCVGTLLPWILQNYLQHASFVDVHNERGVATYIETALEEGISVLVAYLECILLGTIVLAVRAARRIPPFDRDYILILGCQVNGDGTLTKLLQGRADRALEFARLQKEAGGKDPVFVPSGGQGPDEVISEAAAVKRYLLEQGVPEARILTEDKSTDTEENLRCSAALIRETTGEAAPKLAFSTTNYHVFRAGVLAAQQGLDAQGVGSKTKRYFWINAFVREFIATVVSERRVHLRVVGTVLLMLVGMILIRYFSMIL